MNRIVFIALAVVVLCGCMGDPPRFPNASQNSVTFDGESYPLIGGIMNYYGKRYEANEVQGTVNIDLLLYSGDGYDVAFRLHVSDEHQKLAVGEYEFADSYAPFTYSEGVFISNAGVSEDDYAPITGWTVEFRHVESDIYAVIFSYKVLTTDIPPKIEAVIAGKYVGKLQYIDHTTTDEE